MGKETACVKKQASDSVVHVWPRTITDLRKFNIDEEVIDE